jgi:hypothetical protein
MAHDALDIHAREELGISAALQARPVQPRLASALTFAVGAARLETNTSTSAQNIRGRQFED